MHKTQKSWNVLSAPRRAISTPSAFGKRPPTAEHDRANTPSGPGRGPGVYRPVAAATAETSLPAIDKRPAVGTEFLIRTEDLCKTFHGNPVLENVSVGIASGDRLSFVGASGCGKTVLTKHFNGLLEPDSGRVFVAGLDLADATETQLEDLRRQIGYVFQSNALFSSSIGHTVYDNVSLPLRGDPYDVPAQNEREIDARVAEVLEKVGLGREFFDRKPSELSGGQRKRVAVARAIASSPHTVIYDEPTTGLDPESARMVIDLIDRVHETIHNTTIAITHEKKLMERLGRVVYLRDGRIYFDGSYDDFARSDDPVIVHFLDEG